MRGKRGGARTGLGSERRASHLRSEHFVAYQSGSAHRLAVSRTPCASRRLSLQAVSFWPEGAAALSMKNGLYSVHIHMLDGVRSRDSGVLILRNGVIIGGGPYFWSAGSYTLV